MRGCTAAWAWLRTPQARLLILAPAVSQLLTGAKAPAEFFHPQNLLVAVVVYGCGALAVHDLARRWSDGVEYTFWPRLLWLAASYGVLVDGVMLGSYTSLDWSRLGRLADTNHGHLLALNLTWSVIALAHHVALAVVVPIALIELMDPDSRRRAWLGPKGLRRCNRLFYAAVFLGALAQQQRGSKAAYAFVFVLAVLFWRRARWWWPRPPREPRWRLTRWLAVHGPHSPQRVLLGSAAVTLILLMVVYLAPLDPPNGIKVFRVLRIFLGTLAMLVIYIRRLGQRIGFGWSDRHTLAATAGPLLVYAALAFYAAHDVYHGEYPGGMGLVGLVTVAGVWWLRRRVAGDIMPVARQDHGHQGGGAPQATG